MNILQTISGFGAKWGGTSTSTYDLVTALNEVGCPTDILTLLPTDPTDRLMGSGEAWIKALSPDGKTPFGYSRNLSDYLNHTDYDLYHTNGVWMYCNHATASIARKKGKPYLITPHGMLYPQALARSAWKKKLMMKLCFDRDLRMADCIHATCLQEMEHYRRLGYKNPVAVIANPVPVPDFIDDIPSNRAIKRIGFLGRLHPYKNVKALIEAWAVLGQQTRGAELYIMGKGDEAYERHLKEEVQRRKLENVVFSGFVSGREKFEKLATLTALFVPSITENFGMTVAESLLMKTPVMASLGTPWKELNTHRCGWWVSNEVASIAETMLRALSLSEEEREAMGVRGRQMVEADYASKQVAMKMKQLYVWVLGGGEAPQFVYD